MKPSTILFIAIAFLFNACSVEVTQETGDIPSNYDPESRLAELGITLPEPPKPVAIGQRPLRSHLAIRIPRQHNLNLDPQDALSQHAGCVCGAVERLFEHCAEAEPCLHESL